MIRRGQCAAAQTNDHGALVWQNSTNEIPTAHRSDMLTVWRRLHIEVDSMGAVTSNYVTGNITGIAGSSTAATSLTLSVNLRTGLTPADNSANLSSTPSGNGRFENGYIVIGTNSVKTTNTVTANGDTFVSGTSFSIPAQIATNNATNSVGLIIGLNNAVFTVSSSLGTNKYTGWTLQLMGCAFTITTNTANTITVSGTPAIPFLLHDDDDTLLPHLPDTGLMTRKFAPAFIFPFVDGGGNSSNNKQTIGFSVNVDGTSHAALDSEFNLPGAFESQGNRATNYWIAYIMTTYQAQTAKDYDPNISSEWGPQGVNGGGTSYRRGALLFRESLRDYCQQVSVNAAVMADFERRAVVHEIGHQFGCDDNTGGIYDYGLEYDPNADPVFFPIQLNIIRSTINPGE